MLKVRPVNKVIGESEKSLLLARLLSIASLGKQDAIEELTTILLEFSVNSIYEASLDLEVFFGTFIRRSLSEIKPTEFDAIGKDGSEGKYGVLTFPDSPPPNNLPDSGIFTIGDCVTHTDLYHCHGADVGTIELVDSCGDYHVRWKSDGHIGRYSGDNLKLCEISSRSSSIEVSRRVEASTDRGDRAVGISPDISQGR